MDKFIYLKKSKKLGGLGGLNANANASIMITNKYNRNVSGERREALTLSPLTTAGQTRHYSHATQQTQKNSVTNVNAAGRHSRYIYIHPFQDDQGSLHLTVIRPYTPDTRLRARRSGWAHWAPSRSLLIEWPSSSS